MKCSIEYQDDIGRYKVELETETSGWFHNSSHKEEHLFDTVEECYHWALCLLLGNNVSVFRRIRTAEDDEDETVNIQLGAGKRRRRGKKSK